VSSLRGRLMSTAEKSRRVNRHTTRCTSPVSVFPQFQLVSSLRLMKRRPPLLY